MYTARGDPSSQYEQRRGRHEVFADWQQRVTGENNCDNRREVEISIGRLIRIA